jgi:hypothetical protein
MRLFFILPFLLLSSMAHAFIILDSVQTKSGKVEIKQKDEDSEPAVYIANKKLHQFDRRPVFIFAVFRPLGKHGDELILVTDCGATNCDFRIISVDENNKVNVTGAIGNGNDNPSISYDGNALLIDFGQSRYEKKKTIVKFSAGKITTTLAK